MDFALPGIGWDSVSGGIRGIIRFAFTILDGGGQCGMDWTALPGMGWERIVDSVYGIGLCQVLGSGFGGPLGIVRFAYMVPRVYKT